MAWWDGSVLGLVACDGIGTIRMPSWYRGNSDDRLTEKVMCFMLIV